MVVWQAIAQGTKVRAPRTAPGLGPPQYLIGRFSDLALSTCGYADTFWSPVIISGLPLRWRVFSRYRTRPRQVLCLQPMVPPGLLKSARLLQYKLTYKSASASLEGRTGQASIKSENPGRNVNLSLLLCTSPAFFSLFSLPLPQFFLERAQSNSQNAKTPLPEEGTSDLLDRPVICPPRSPLSSTRTKRTATRKTLCPVAAWPEQFGGNPRQDANRPPKFRLYPVPSSSSATGL